MDTSFIIRLRDTVNHVVRGRPNIVRTELSASQSVNAAPRASLQQSTPDHLRDPSIDAQCQSLLDREREEREQRERRRARKDDLLMRLRAYGRNPGKPAPDASDGNRDDQVQHADIKV
jgi:hypothetical protein